MQNPIALLQGSPLFERIRRLAAGGEARLENLWGSSMAFLLAGLGLAEQRVILCLLPGMEQAEEFAEDLNTFAPGLASYFPAWETLDEDELPEADIVAQRVTLLRQLFRERDEHGRKVVVAPLLAALQQVAAPESIDENTLEIGQGDTLDLEEALAWLDERDFRPAPQVEEPGEFARRGGILDVYPYTAELPVRIEFFGDEVESLRAFDPDTQTSVTPMTHCRITALSRRLAARERTTQRSIFDYMPEDSWLALRDPAELMDRAETLSIETGGAPAGWGVAQLRGAIGRFPTIHMAAMPAAFGEGALDLDVRSVERFGQSVENVRQELERIVAEGRRAIVFCNNDAEKSRLGELLAGSPLPKDPRFGTRVAHLNKGFDWPEIGVALLPHHDIFHRYRTRRTKSRLRHTRALDSFLELSEGDLVVHVGHGIGRFRGMKILETEGGQRRECLRIEYDEGATLYVPANKIELVQKYIGPSEARPRLSRLGAKAWSRAKDRAETAVEDLAAELLRVQAARETQEGIRHPPDTDWQDEFEQAFIYQETEDQLRIAEEIKADLESPRPMDRLVCGDVGYGKTELAMRAAFKVVIGGAQVAILAPTTVLALQHYRTFSERMRDYPIVVDMLSRLRTKTQQGETLVAARRGSVDIVIGTHRLVQDDVAFKNLGLIIIDEEQRFGVAHKEKLKQMRETVDVLTLTATPIPRTLHMSMLGMRDISSLQTPPRDRLAIQTRLWRHEPQRIRQAILRELARDGQVFFVHNRVENIDHVAAQVRALAPEARVLVGHGQMPERQLESVMRRFVDHEADILVCTTIIESGLDIPNVNTIFINEADMFGLAQLHQLRGRVGRYKHRAYAYILLPRRRPVTPVAAKRLKALQEFADLGAGFRIAMRDLEIRGAGNILGPEQSGHIAAVGYEFYCRLLEVAVRRLKQDPAPVRLEVSIVLGLEAHFPESYIPDPRHRIEMYRRLHRARTAGEARAVAEQLRDRFGPLPPEANNLLEEALLRVECERWRVKSIVRDGRDVTIEVEDLALAARAFDAAGRRVRALDDKTLFFRLESPDTPPELTLRYLLRTMRKASGD